MRSCLKCGRIFETVLRDALVVQEGCIVCTGGASGYVASACQTVLVALKAPSSINDEPALAHQANAVGVAKGAVFTLVTDSALSSLVQIVSTGAGAAGTTLIAFDALFISAGLTVVRGGVGLKSGGTGSAAVIINARSIHLAFPIGQIIISSTGGANKIAVASFTTEPAFDHAGLIFQFVAGLALGAGSGSCALVAALGASTADSR